MLCVLFWVIHRPLNFMPTFWDTLFHLHRQVGAYKQMYMRGKSVHELSVWALFITGESACYFHYWSISISLSYITTQDLNYFVGYSDCSVWWMMVNDEWIFVEWMNLMSWLPYFYTGAWCFNGSAIDQNKLIWDWLFICVILTQGNVSLLE